MRITASFLVIVAYALGGCKSDSTGTQSGSSAAGYTVEMERTRPGSGGASAPVSLCEIVNTWGAGAGIYRVTKLLGVAEEDPAVSTNILGYTYVSLELEKAWTPTAKEKVVARILGGPIGPDKWLLASVDLKVSEVAGMILWDNSDMNGGYVTIPPTGLLQPGPDGKVIHMGLFGNSAYTLEEIGDMVADVWGTSAADCPPPIVKELSIPDGSDVQNGGPDGQEILPTSVE